MPRPVRLLYFAWLRDRLGRSEEAALLPDHVLRAGDLLDWLRANDPAFAALAAEGRIRVAINQQFAAPDDPIAAGDEIALFPPVTGG